MQGGGEDGGAGRRREEERGGRGLSLSTVDRAPDRVLTDPERPCATAATSHPPLPPPPRASTGDMTDCTARRPPFTSTRCTSPIHSERHRELIRRSIMGEEQCPLRPREERLIFCGRGATCDVSSARLRCRPPTPCAGSPQLLPSVLSYPHPRPQHEKMTPKPMRTDAMRLSAASLTMERALRLTDTSYTKNHPVKAMPSASRAIHSVRNDRGSTGGRYGCVATGTIREPRMTERRGSLRTVKRR